MTKYGYLKILLKKRSEDELDNLFVCALKAIDELEEKIAKINKEKSSLKEQLNEVVKDNNRYQIINEQLEEKNNDLKNSLINIEAGFSELNKKMELLLSK